MSRFDQDTAAWTARRRLQGLLLRGSRAGSPGGVVRQLTAVQAQVHGYARWSVAQRNEGQPSASVVDSAFDEGSILRTHVLRPTWHYVAASDLGWLMRLSGPRVEAGNASMYRNLELDAGTFERTNALIAAYVEEGPRTRDELFAMLESHGVSTPNNRGVHMLMHAELTSVICSGPMRGKQHTYAAFNQRAPASGPEGD
ncbi:MAG TPA: crosslink repair DNA glycosylase YcaQ family protein, partial [Thermomicrobiaceae bacterium]|nr:crosslink repair DNA glycosylase YcaQ family protein [Thermomicrobiaceae bacterium]